MTVAKKLLDLLVCPSCKGELAARSPSGDPAGEADAAGQLAVAALDCPRCRLRFPVVDDIPVLVIDQAERIRS